MSKKKTALAQVKLAAMELFWVQPGRVAYTKSAFQKANCALVMAQLAAADAGASSREITHASEWEGIAI